MKPPTVVLCGGTNAPRGVKEDDLLSLNLRGTNHNVLLKATDISRKLAANIPPHLIDLLEVASYVYCADLLKPRGGVGSFDYGKRWRRHFRFVIPVREPDMWTSDVAEALADALAFVADEKHEFEFVPDRRLPSNMDPYFEFPPDSALGSSAEEVLLFSGGLDSLAGAIQSSVVERRQVALVSHRSSGKIAGHQRELVKLINGIHPEAKLFHIPIWVHQHGTDGREATQRTRCFLYSALGCVVASMYGQDRIRFYENGITSLNLPISEQISGARASRSTHPQALSKFARFYSLLTGGQFLIESPFLWKTKKEIVNLVGDGGCGQLIEASRSCLHVRETTTMVTHCGRCSQCVSRRFATLASKYSRYDPPGRYASDLLTDARDRGPDLTMVESYPRFATDIRTISEVGFFEKFPEYHRIPTYLEGSIDESAKRILDLHRRHGEDVERVLVEAIKRNAQKIHRGELPITCLVMLAVPRKPKMEADGRIKFHMQGGLDWQEIEIRLIDGETASILARGIRKPYSFVEMGMADGRNKKASKQWDLLSAFVDGRGAITWKDSNADRRNQKRRESLSRDLRSFFGIDSDPIEFDSENKGWRLKIRVSPEAYCASENSLSDLQ